MKHVLSCLFLFGAAASVGNSAVVTTTTCEAKLGDLVLASQSSAGECLLDEKSPAYPEFRAYRATATASGGVLSGHLATRSESGVWIEPFSWTSASASASVQATETWVIAGSGAATFRWRGFSEKVGFDNGGLFSFVINGFDGVGHAYSSSPSFFQFDATINLGVPFVVSSTATAHSNAFSLSNSASGIYYGITSLNIYNSNGIPIGDTMISTDGGQTFASRSFPDDGTRGPVMATVPEPSSFGPLTALTFAFCFRAFRHGRERKSC